MCGIKLLWQKKIACSLGLVKMFIETANDTHHHIKYGVNLEYANLQRRKRLSFQGSLSVFSSTKKKAQIILKIAAIFPEWLFNFSF